MTHAVIFDMDGVISDTQSLHAQVESQVLKKFGITLSPTYITEHFSGTKDVELFIKILAQHKSHESAQKLLEEKWQRMYMHEDKIRAIDYVKPFIASLSAQGLLLAVGSASRTQFVEYVLNKLDLRKYFSVIASSYDVALGKPHPDLFLLAAHKLNVTPDTCVVVEDAPAGIEAANRAGMKSIGITTTHTKADLKMATKIIDSFTQISVDEIKNL